MECKMCSQPMKAKLAGRNKVPVWECAPCKIQLDRKPVTYQHKLPGLDPGVQCVKVQEEKKRRKKLEHIMQCNLFDKIRKYESDYHALPYIMAVPNGGYRPISVAKEMVREGARAGVPDILIPVARRGFHADWIEMKVEGNYPSENQKRWHNFLRSENQRVNVFYSMEDAWEEICWYLSLKVGTRKFIRETPQLTTANR